MPGLRSASPTDVATAWRRDTASSPTTPTNAYAAKHPVSSIISMGGTRLPLSGPRAWHILPIAVLPGHARGLTKSLNARAAFSRQRHSVIIVARTATVEPAGVEPGEEDGRDNQEDQDDAGDNACPDRKPVDRVWPLPSRRIGRIGVRGKSCRLVSGGRVGHAPRVSRNRVPAISHGDNVRSASVWRGTMRPIEFADA